MDSIMHVAIIGANGLLSTSIAMHCNKLGYPVSIYGRTSPEFIDYTKFKHVDLLTQQLNYDEISQADVIVYAAGAGIQSNLKQSPETIYHLNTTVPVNICNALRDINYKGVFISFGSYFEIGETDSNKLYTEEEVLRSDCLAPNDYAISKRMFSCFINSIKTQFSLFHFVLPTIYGEREQPHRLIPYTLKAIETDAPLSFTSGEQTRQYIYIDDVVNIVFNAIDNNIKSGIYNIEGVEDLSVKELVKMLFSLKNKPLPDNLFGTTQRADSGMKVLKLNGKKLTECINFHPTTKIADVYNRYNF